MLATWVGQFHSRPGRCRGAKKITDKCQDGGECIYVGCSHHHTLLGYDFGSIGTSLDMRDINNNGWTHVLHVGSP